MVLALRDSNAKQILPKIAESVRAGVRVRQHRNVAVEPVMLTKSMLCFSKS